MDKQKLIDEIKILELQMSNLTRRYSRVNVFLNGIINGIGILVGATLLVLVGSVILNILGFFPILVDIVNVVKDAFAEARIK